MIKIAYILAPTDSRFSEAEMTYQKFAPSAGLTILASETEKRSFQEIKSKIYISPIINSELIEHLSEFEVIALSSWFSNYENACKIAERVKNNNNKVKIVIGGQNATNLGHRVLINRPYIDYVISGDGEDSLWQIVNCCSNGNIPNLWYRDLKNEPRFTFQNNVNLNEIQPWDLKSYDPNFIKDYSSKCNEKRNHYPPLGLSITRGCFRSVKVNHRCDYCSLPIKGFRFTDPIRAWSQIHSLHCTYGITDFFETGDDFAYIPYLTKFLKEKPEEIPFRLRIYANPNAINRDCVKLLADIGVYEVFLGLETADDTISKRVGHNSTISNVINAICWLEERNISVCLPFLFGLPGEDLNSIKKTSDFAKDLISRFSNIRMVLTSLAIPLIGSNWFTRLEQNREVKKEYNKIGNLECDDIFDYLTLLSISLKHESKITIEDLLSHVTQFRVDIQKNVTLGCFGGIEKYSNNLIQS
jgi:anaerobic magnesium-protoporphyrin IX monomethyl ester cyclase